MCAGTTDHNGNNNTQQTLIIILYVYKSYICPRSSCYVHRSYRYSYMCVCVCVQVLYTLLANLVMCTDPIVMLTQSPSQPPINSLMTSVITPSHTCLQVLESRWKKILPPIYLTARLSKLFYSPCMNLYNNSIGGEGQAHHQVRCTCAFTRADVWR